MKSLKCNICEKSHPAKQTYYGICLDCWHFLGMNIFTYHRKGLFNDDKNWSMGHIPQGLETAIIPKGKYCINKGMQKHKYVHFVIMEGASFEMEPEAFDLWKKTIDAGITHVGKEATWKKIIK